MKRWIPAFRTAGAALLVAIGGSRAVPQTHEGVPILWSAPARRVVPPPVKEPAAYREHALTQHGNPERGQRLFEDPLGAGCIKCHAVAGQGGKVGPDLLGIGGRYPREELIRSVLEPSSRILTGYEVTIISTTAGRTLEGIVVRRRANRLELIDVQGQRIVVLKPEIEEEQRSQLSLMPSGLKDGLTLDDFVDLIAYLETL